MNYLTGHESSTIVPGAYFRVLRTNTIFQTDFRVVSVGENRMVVRIAEDGEERLVGYAWLQQCLWNRFVVATS